MTPAEQAAQEMVWHRGFRVVDGRTVEVEEAVISRSEYDALLAREQAARREERERISAWRSKYVGRALTPGSAMWADLAEVLRRDPVGDYQSEGLPACGTISSPPSS